MILQRFLSSRFYCIILILSLLFCYDQIKAQNKTKDFKISVQWQPVQNNFEGKNQSLSVLSLTNESELDLPSYGWSLYFNYSGDFLKTDSRGLTISFVNGDLYKIEPNAASDGISAGAKIDFQMVRSGNIDNVTQSPQGFYIVLSDSPDKAIPVTSIYPDPAPEFLNSLPSSKTWMDPAYVYSKNQEVQDIASSKLPLIFPSPVEYKVIYSEYTISGNTAISSDPLFAKEAGYLIEELGKVLNSKPLIKQNSTSGIVLRRDPEGAGSDEFL